MKAHGFTQGLRAQMWDAPKADLAVKQILDGYWRSIDANQKKIISKKGDEAIHDFRVSVRRFLTWAKEGKKDLFKDFPKHVIKEAKMLVDESNAARDAEVRLSLLSKLLGKSKSQSKLGALKKGWKAELAQSQSHLAELTAEGVADLSEALSAYWSTGQQKAKGAAIPFARWVKKRLRKAARQLDQRLSEIEKPKQAPKVHKGRLATKKLRYLLEPLARESAIAKNLSLDLRKLQDLLGDLRDHQQLLLHLRKNRAKKDNKDFEILADRLTLQIDSLFSAFLAQKEKSSFQFEAIVKKMDPQNDSF